MLLPLLYPSPDAVMSTTKKGNYENFMYKNDSGRERMENRSTIYNIYSIKFILTDCLHMHSFYGKYSLSISLSIVNFTSSLSSIIIISVIKTRNS